MAHGNHRISYLMNKNAIIMHMIIIMAMHRALWPIIYGSILVFSGVIYSCVIWRLCLYLRTRLVNARHLCQDKVEIIEGRSHVFHGQR